MAPVGEIDHIPSMRPMRPWATWIKSMLRPAHTLERAST